MVLVLQCTYMLQASVQHWLFGTGGHNVTRTRKLSTRRDVTKREKWMVCTKQHKKLCLQCTVLVFGYT